MNAEPNTAHPSEWYVDHLLAEATRLSAAIARGPLDTSVESCPGWDLAQLVAHVGAIHRWAGHCAVHAEPPSDRGSLRPGDRDLVEWFDEGVHELAELLRAIDPAAPTWHPFPTEQVGAFWPRRQAHETCMHRWDAERAVGQSSPIDPELASDGIDEYFEAVLPRLFTADGVAVPSGSLHVHCTDVDGEWLVWNEGGEYMLERAHRKGDAALRGPAEAILLRLWGRKSPRADELSPIGDESVLAAWLDLGGA